MSVKHKLQIIIQYLWYFVVVSVMLLGSGSEHGGEGLKLECGLKDECWLLRDFAFCTRAS